MIGVISGKNGGNNSAVYRMGSLRQISANQPVEKQKIRNYHNNQQAEK
jgi:hypothetical protein